MLIDSSVWIDHLRQNNAELVGLLQAGQVLTHPYIIGEILLGSLAQRDRIATLFDALPQTKIAKAEEVRSFIENARLYGRGIGWVDASLLAACQLTPDTTLLTRDKRLGTVAGEVGLG